VGGPLGGQQAQVELVSQAGQAAELEQEAFWRGEGGRAVRVPGGKGAQGVDFVRLGRDLEQQGQVFRA
jgi:hypothetical protein